MPNSGIFDPDLNSDGASGDGVKVYGTVASSASYPDVTVSGSLTSTGSVTATSLDGMCSAGVVTTGTWVGTLIIEHTVDGTTWNEFKMFSDEGYMEGTFTSENHELVSNLGGSKQLRVRCSAYTSGTIEITIRLTFAHSPVIKIVGQVQDEVTQRLVTEDGVHYEVHEGDAYNHSHVHTLANAETYYHQIVTPAAPISVHLRYAVSSTGGLTINLYKDPTISVNGSASFWNNKNHSSSNTASTLMYHNPTVSATGTFKEGFNIGTNGGEKSGAIGFSDEGEIVLAPSTTYLIRYVSGASSNAVSENFFIYEEGA